MNLRKWYTLLLATLTLITVNSAQAAYDHGGADTDSAVFLGVYPDKAGTKLDSCALCHTSGAYEKKPGKWVTLGSCQWCHYSYGYDMSGNIEETLNPYGVDYGRYGKSSEAFQLIQEMDSDNDGYTNAEEISALRFPGNADDDPTKVPAPFKIYTLEELERLDQHTQFMLMNTHKSGDFYAEYRGISMADLLDLAGRLPSASGIKVYAPDGWSQYHPLEEDADPLFYHVYGHYPQATYWYDPEADVDVNLDYGWCDYAAPSCSGRTHGDPIATQNGLKLMLAFVRNGNYLETGELNEDNKLDGEGPFRVVPPQKVPGPPDQSTKYDGDICPIWPFNEAADHNAGFATRSATMIRVDPLPEGTTDIDTLETGWNYVDEGKIIVYGAVDPLPTINTKINELYRQLRTEENSDFKHRMLKWVMAFKLSALQKKINKGRHSAALTKIERGLLAKTDGCVQTGSPDRNDWITDCDLQTRTYWAIHEIRVLLKILD